MKAYRRAVGLKPNYPEAFCNAGAALRSMGRYEASVMWLDAAIRLKPDYAEAYSNRALALKDDGQINAAVESFDIATKLKEDYANAYLNKAFSLLLYDRYEAAWPLYEWCFQSTQAFKSAHNYRQEAWNGDVPIAGKTLLIHSEQGFGDTLQGLRYVPLAIAQGGKVMLALPQSLCAIAQRMAPEAQVMAEELIEQDPALQKRAASADLRCMFMSLPLAFQTTLESIPAAEGYLKADPQAVEHYRQALDRLEQDMTMAQVPGRKRPRIGLVWRGKALPDPHRSISFELLSAYLPKGPLYVSLQQVHRDEDVAIMRERGDVIAFGEARADFDQTAALASCLDLNLCIDTSVAHLLGALGLPTWILLRRQADWRWGRDREYSPWYRSLKLYRQKVHNDWTSVLPRLQSDLSDWVKS